MIRTCPHVLALGIALVAIGAPALAQPSDRALSGVYFCQGRNGDGSLYRGLVVIARRGDAYDVRWRFPGNVAARGIGIRTGDMLAVSYYGSSAGIVVYRVAGERLVGRWTVPGGNGLIASETLTPIRPGTGSDGRAAPERPAGGRTPLEL